MWAARVLKRSDGKRKADPAFAGPRSNEKLLEAQIEKWAPHLLLVAFHFGNQLLTKGILKPLLVGLLLRTTISYKTINGTQQNTADQNREIKI